MRKASLSLLILLSATIVSYSQLKVAIVAGGHQATVLEENNLPDWNEIKENISGRVGVHAGFVADLPFAEKSKLYFQPGVIYYNKGRKYSQQFDPSTSTVTSIKSTEYINYIDVPLNLVLKFGNKTRFIIGGGPYGSFFFTGKQTLQVFTETGITTDEENDDLPVGKKPGQYRVLNFGVNGLAGVEFGRVFITANYSRGLNDFYESADYEGTFKHQVIGGTLGIFLGNPVKIEKKIKDKDKDGIADEQDNCPSEAGSAITNGCPDKDGDGIADREDKCPGTPGIKANSGCPVTDRDNDGVNDADDKCPDVAGLIKYNGCPVPDTDKDGINDEEDKCPSVAGYGRYGGCPVPDSDGDGVNDDDDKCPGVKGIREKNGCPEEIKKELIEKVNYAAKRIQFQSGKAILLPQSLKVLDEVASLLRQNPALNLKIEGHSSADGSLAGNIKLSEDRANSVETYLVSKGIDRSRLESEGFGPSKPLNNGTTTAERAQNRRVELKLSN